MRKLVVVCGLVLLAGAADAQRSGTHRPGHKSPQARNSKYGAKKQPVSKATGKSRRPVEEGRKFNISLGISLAFSNTVTKTYSDAGGTGVLTKSASAFGLFVYPKYHVYSTEKYAVSVGIPLSLAFSGSASANSRTGSEGGGSFMYDLPLMVDYNGGCMSPQGRYGESRIGYFAGAGLGMQNGDATSYAYAGTGNVNYDSDLKVKSVGPVIHAGGVLRIGSEERPRYIGLRIAYKIGLNKDGHNYLTPSIFLNI